MVSTGNEIHKVVVLVLQYKWRTPMNKAFLIFILTSFGCYRAMGPCEFTIESGESYCIEVNSIPASDSAEGSVTYTCPPEGLPPSEPEWHHYKLNTDPITCSTLGFTTHCGGIFYSSSEESCNALVIEEEKQDG